VYIYKGTFGMNIDVTATFGIAKGNIQSVLTLVIRDPGGEG
jgi:hypothetical protein